MRLILSPEEGDAGSRLLLFRDRELLVHPGGWLWRSREIPPLHETSPLLPLQPDPQQSATGTSFAAVPVEEEWARRLEAAEAVNPRELLLQEGADRFALIGQAIQRVHWYRSHRFCGQCGQPTGRRGPNRVLACAACNVDYYPRINPCIIVLVTRGRQVLLGRNARHRAGYYSCLAGFIEAGETPEQAVHREVAEETGVAVRNIRYVDSQPWPFPSQLMLGFVADYAGGDVRLPDGELDDAQWFDIDALPPVPSSQISVAGRLIREYCASLNESAVPGTSGTAGA